MAVIKAFKAIRPVPEKACDVAALPYDVYSKEEARLAVIGKPDSFLRIDRAETTMDEIIAFDDPAVYIKAKENLQALIDRAMIREKVPCFYLYELEMTGRKQCGLVSCTPVDDYLNGKIKKHELTREDKELDRICHIETCNAHTGPIFLTYRARDEINTIIQAVKERTLLYDFVSEDGIGHRVWRIYDENEINSLKKAFEGVDVFYIADGHHRCASAAKVALKRRKENPDYTGDEGFNDFLAVIFPDSELIIMDYNRVVRDLNGLSKEAFLKAVSKDFIVENYGRSQVKPEEKGVFGMFLDDEWYRLKIKPEYCPDGLYPDCLDVAVLQDHLLAPVLEIGDPRTDQRIDFVGGIHGLEELERRVHTDMQIAFSVYPTKITEVMAIADAGLLMPPKSTWFEPKLRSGLFVHELS